MLWTSFSDAQCGFKAVSRRTVAGLVPEIKDQSWFFDTELLVLAEKRGLSHQGPPGRVDRGRRQPGEDRPDGLGRHQGRRPASAETLAGGFFAGDPAGGDRLEAGVSPAGAGARAGGPVFVTGGTGFVGRRLLPALDRLGLEARCLVRPSAPPPAPRPHLTIIAGDITRDGDWTGALSGCDTVLHLAATTGKASPARHQAVNLGGLQRTLAAARRAGVRRFVLVSSVAAAFRDIRFYPYAAAKRAAEAALAESDLDYLIVRPTAVLGPGSPVLASLARLASLPVGVMFGSGRVPVQPVHVDDVAALLARAATLAPLGRRTVDLGGPEVLSMADLLGRIRIAAKGRPGPFLHLPIEPLRTLLGWAEPVLLPILPFAAGQLCSFLNDGRAAPDPLLDGPNRPSRSIADMLAAPSAPDATP